MHAVSDMGTRLRNALQVRHESVEVSNTKLLRNIAEILKKEGFIHDFSVCSETVPQGTLTLQLKYIGKKQKPSLTHFQPMSKPGLRVYVPAKKLPQVLNGLGIAIISTSMGVLTEKEAKARGVGGELLCYIW